MTPIVEKRLQMVAQRVGLRVIADRHASRATGQKCYLLRPASDARRVVQILPDGKYCLESFWENGRRYIGSRMSFEEVERFLARCEPVPAGSSSRKGLKPAGERPTIGRGPQGVINHTTFSNGERRAPTPSALPETRASRQAPESVVSCAVNSA